MPFDVVGFCEATPGTGTNPILAALGENLYNWTGDFITVKEAAAFVVGVFSTNTSTGGDILLRQAGLIDYAIKKGSLVADVAALCSFTNYFGRPLPLSGGDNLSTLVVNATDEASLVGVLLSSGKMTQAMLDAVNPTHVISGYSDTTVTAYTWSACPITWNQTLKKGTYEVVGMRCTLFGGADMGLARINIPGNNAWRPGVPASRAAADHEEWQSLEKMPACDWPLMGIKFTVPGQMPNIDVLSIGADTDENVELTLQKIA